jgi:hypothetical protein
MPSERRTLGLLIVMLIAALGAVGQSKVPPPPKPGDQGPSLNVTMQFIQDKLNNLGKVSWVEVKHNSKDGTDARQSLVHELSAVVADAAACKISLHRKVTSDNAANPFDYEMTLPLKMVENLSVMTQEQHTNLWFAQRAQPEITTSVSPSISALLIHFSDKRQDEFFAFFDEDLANRLAKAMVHAVEICGGGGKPEPF